MTVSAIASEEAPLDQRFQFTGSLLETSVYLPRPADDELESLLFAGSYCNIIAPRQIGKTSLRVRVASRLERRGRRCVAIDLTSLGTVRKDEEWYFGFIYAIARSLGQPSPWPFWKELAGVPFARRWADYLLSLAEQFPNGLVIFVDEIEAVLLSDTSTSASAASLSAEERFSRDDFFTAIRALFEGRNQDERCRRLTFCLVGVTTPSDLVVNKKVTPFNISRSLLLQDFTRGEIDALATPLSTLGANTSALLDAIFWWTDGHPYMTMRICASVARMGTIAAGQERQRVDQVVQREFLDHALQDPNLNYAARRFDDTRFEAGGVTLTDKILLYDKVLANEFVEDQVEDNVQLELRLAGIIKAVYTDQGRGLRVRNRIFARALDREWLASKGDRREIATGVWSWTKAERNPEWLFRGAKLREALSRARSGVPLSPIEREFLTESQRVETEALQRLEAEARDATEAKQREAAELSKKEQRLRRLVWILSWVAAAGVVFVAFLFFQQRQQQLQTEEAQAEEAKARQSAAVAEKARTDAQAAVKKAQQAQEQALREVQAAADQQKEAEDAAELAKQRAARAVAEANREIAAREAKLQTDVNANGRLSEAEQDRLRTECALQISSLEQKNAQLENALAATKARLDTCDRGSTASQTRAARP